MTRFCIHSVAFTHTKGVSLSVCSTSFLFFYKFAFSNMSKIFFSGE
jgi:hypothetical protein